MTDSLFIPAGPERWRQKGSLGRGMNANRIKQTEISEQSLNWIFQKGMRFILILLQQFKYPLFSASIWLDIANRISMEAPTL